MQRIDVRFRIDCQGANAQLFAGTNHPQRDFTAIGNQDFLEHRFFVILSAAKKSLINSLWPRPEQ